VVKNDKDELIPTRIQSEWRVCIDYKKLNSATRKDHFPLPFLDQMLERLAEWAFYCFLDGYSGNTQIFTAPENQEMTTFMAHLALIPLGRCSLVFATWPRFKGVRFSYFSI